MNTFVSLLIYAMTTTSSMYICRYSIRTQIFEDGKNKIVKNVNVCQSHLIY